MCFEKRLSTSADLTRQSLERLEYGRYDSAGIASVSGTSTSIKRDVGRIDEIDARPNFDDLSGLVAVGDTRWGLVGRQLRLLRTRNISTADLFFQSLIDCYGRDRVYSDGADCYPAVCRSVSLEHRVYNAVKGNVMERFVQHVMGWLRYYQLGFNLFKRRDALKRSPIPRLGQIIRGPKDARR